MGYYQAISISSICDTFPTWKFLLFFVYAPRNFGLMIWLLLFVFYISILELFKNNKKN
jgi:hypothetical protein